MSGFWGNTGGGGGGSLAGTAVDPVGLSGGLIHPNEITQPGGPYPAGYVLTADGLGGWVALPNTATNKVQILFSYDTGVPAFGTRYLRFGEGVISSSTGLRLPGTSTLKALTITTSATSTNTYQVQFLLDPAAKLGPSTTLATLSLPATSYSAIITGLSGVITSGTEFGVRVVRIAGSGAGLSQIGVVAEIELS